MPKIRALLWVVVVGFAGGVDGGVVTGADVTILDDALADGWGLVGAQGAQPLGLLLLCRLQNKWVSLLKTGGYLCP